jgi:protein-disulfide isomerase
VIPQLIEQYVDTGKARYVYREFPLTQIHPAAQKASEAALCAGEQGSYWEMNEHLFANQAEWSQAEDPTASFKEYAGELGLDTNAFDTCLDSGEMAVAVQGDLLAGESLGVSATPYFFINDLPIRGGLSIDALGQVIDYVAAGGEQPEIVPLGDDWHLRGDRQTARAITVAFVDYGSPESRQHALEVLPELVREYIDTGKLVYVLHPWSSDAESSSAQAAIAAECAGQQGQYWEMHDLLFEDQDAWSQAEEPRSLFGDYADSLALDTDQFEECLDSEWAALRVRAGNVDEFKAIIDSIVNQ